MSESKIAVKPRAPISMKELRRMFASGLTMKDKPSNDENDSDDESSESESDSDAENQSDSDEDSKCDMKDDKEEKKKSSKSNSKDEVSEQRVPLKPVESLSLEEFEPVNEFGVRYKTIVECDGKCEKDENGKTLCICQADKNRGNRIHIKLYPHQIDAVKRMAQLELAESVMYGIRGSANVSAMSAGKSIEMLTLIMRDYALPTPPLNPTLIVCPRNAIRDPWEEQIVKFLGSSCPYLIFRRDAMGNEKYNSITLEEMRQYKIILTNYETVRSVASKYKMPQALYERDQCERKIYMHSVAHPSERMMSRKGDRMLFNTPYHRVIFDESSDMIANPKTATYEAVMCLYGERKHCLTATFIRNRERDAYAQFRVLGFDRILLPKQFTSTAFESYGLRRFMIVMSLETAGIVLPELTMKEVKIQLKEREKEAYDFWTRATRQAYRQWSLGCMQFANVLTTFLRQRQCCVSAYTVTKESSRGWTPLEEEDEESYSVAQKYMNDMTSGLADWIRDGDGTAGVQAAKIKEIVRIIRDEIPATDKVNIFSNFKKVLDVIANALKTELPDVGYVIVDGDVTGKDRDKAFDSFKRGSARVLLMTYKVGAFALNLSESNNTILTETVWTPAIWKQAAARTRRLGQKKKMTVWQLIMQGTIEEAMMMEICVRKQQVSDDFMAGKKMKVNAGSIDAKTLGRLLNYG